MTAASLQPREPLRIVFVDYVLEPDKPGRSGLSDLVWDMASCLVDCGHDVHVVASYAAGRMPDPRVTVHNFAAPPFGYRNVLGNFWLLKRAAAVAAKLDPHIIHAPEYVSTAVFARLGIETPLVFTTPGNIYHRIEHGHSYERHYVQVLKWAANVSARECAAVIAVSDEMKRWWQWTGSPAERTFNIPQGVDSALFSPDESARDGLHLDRDALLLLYAGRLAPEKGLPDLLDALAALPPQVLAADVQLHILGDGPQRVELERHVAGHGLRENVFIHGWIDKDDLPSWYAAADAFVLPSYSEGFSRTVAEALSSGTAVIGSAITGTEDHIDDGRNGFLFKPGDTRRLASLLETVAQDPGLVRDMSARCRQYALANLDWPRIVDRIIVEVYEPLRMQVPNA